MWKTSEDFSEKAMATHSSTLAWKIPWMEEPGRLQSMGSLRVEHDWVTSLSLFTFMHWRRKWQPTPVFLPGESQGWGSLPSMGLHRVGHDWSDLAAAAAAAASNWVMGKDGHNINTAVKKKGSACEGPLSWHSLFGYSSSRRWGDLGFRSKNARRTMVWIAVILDDPW